MEKANKGCVRRGKTLRADTPPGVGVIPYGKSAPLSLFLHPRSRRSADFSDAGKIHNERVERFTYWTDYLEVL